MSADGTGLVPCHPASGTAAGWLDRLTREALPLDLQHLADGPMAAALGEAITYAQNTVSPATEKTYADDWSAFQGWCREHGAPSLPAPPAVVAAYIAKRSDTLGRSGLRVALAAIAFHHRRSGHLWSSADPVIASVMHGILRKQRKPVRPAAALTSEELRTLLGGCGDDLGGVQDRALPLTGFAGALRRSELVGLDVADLRFGKDGVALRIRHSKRDQEGQGADVGIAFGQHPGTCPVAALRRWLERGRVRYGPVFRSVTAAGAVGTGLSAHSVWKILRRQAAGVGLTVHDTERLSPHGLRAGFITEAYLNGALDEQVAHHARQSDLNTTRGYRRRAKTVPPARPSWSTCETPPARCGQPPCRGTRPGPPGRVPSSGLAASHADRHRPGRPRRRVPDRGLRRRRDPLAARPRGGRSPAVGAHDHGRPERQGAGPAAALRRGRPP